jgi:hypothetical protein
MSSYVCLIVPKKLHTAAAKQWFQCVASSVPSGLIGETSLYSDADTKTSNFYAKKTRSGKVSYVIPLVRDLDASEVHSLVQQWCKSYPTGDFLVDYSQNSLEPLIGTNSLEQSKIKEILDLWAKSQHNTWMKDAVDKGWKFGLKMSSREKTHPLIQPWEQLPTYAREQNLAAVEDLIKILDSFGYEITQKPTA